MIQKKGTLKITSQYRKEKEKENPINMVQQVVVLGNHNCIDPVAAVAVAVEPAVVEVVDYIEVVEVGHKKDNLNTAVEVVAVVVVVLVEKNKRKIRVLKVVVNMIAVLVEVVVDKMIVFELEEQLENKDLPEVVKNIADK